MNCPFTGSIIFARAKIDSHIVPGLKCVYFKLIYVMFGQNNMHITLDFYSRQARKETNVTTT